MQPSIEKNNDKLLRKFHAAMKYARGVCILGSTNIVEDITRTGGWVFTQQYRYDQSGRYVISSRDDAESDDMVACNMFYHHKIEKCDKIKSVWYFRVNDVDNSGFNQLPANYEVLTAEDPLHDPQFKLSPETMEIFVQSFRSLSTRAGNCGAQSYLVTKFLWEYPEGIDRIEGIWMHNFDHAFVVINRSGEMEHPETWGDAWIIDPWALGGMIYPAYEFTAKLRETKQFCRRQITEMMRIGIYAPLPDDAPDCWSRVWEVKPHIDPYPSYKANMKVDDYYRFEDNRYANGAPTFAEVKARHAKKFKDCCKEIETAAISGKWARIFSREKKSEELSGNHPPVPQF